MSVFQRNKDVVSRTIAGEFFLVPVAGNLADMERLFVLSAVGEFIWDRVDGKRSLDDICDEVVAKFDVAKDRADPDIREFVAELVSAGLIQEAAN